MSRYWVEREDLGRKTFPPALPHKLESLRGPGATNVIFKSFAVCGAHPGSNTSEIVANLTPLLRAGITTFVCLQNELPRAGHSIAHQRSAYGTGNVVTAKNYLPDAQAIIDAGGFPQSGTQLSFLHLPIPDSNGATVPDDVLKPFILNLLAYMKAGEYLFIQCGDGNGRSGTIAAILLGLAYGLSSSEALDLAQRSRVDRPGISGNCPETHEQKMQVHRLLSDHSFRDAAAVVPAARSKSLSADDSTQLESTVKKIRAVLSKKGVMSLIYLRRYAGTLATLASAGSPDPVLDYNGFLRLTQDAEWYLTPPELDSLWDAVATPDTSGAGARSVRSGAAADNKAGVVSINKLFRTIRGPLSARRLGVIHEVFRRLSFNTGVTTVEMLAAAFHPETHPDVRATRRVPAAVKDEFYDTFGIGLRDEHSKRQVDAGEFEEYYADISAAIDDDAYFEILVFGCWPHTDVTRKPSGKTTMASRVAASSAARSVAPKPSVPSVLIDAYVKGSGKVVPPAYTESGYTYFDVSAPAFAVDALRLFLSSKSDFMVSVFGAMLRRNDPRRDGQVDVYEFKQALKDSGAELPDIDAETAFLGIAADLYGVKASELEITKTLLPIEDAHQHLREPLSDAKRALVLQTFNSFDKEGVGAVPVATMVLAFKAEAYPPVATGKMSPHVVYKQFQDAFAEGFALIDKNGPAARAAGYGTPPAKAYYGLGDGLVRFPFFEAFHEGLAASIRDDGAFGHVVSHIWSGGNIRRAQKASLDPHTVARRADVQEDGFLSNMERLSMNHPYSNTVPSNSGGTATRSFAHKGDTAIGTSAPRPPTHSAMATPPREPSSIYSGGDGYTGRTSSALRSSPRYTVGPGHAPASYSAAPSTGDKDRDSVLDQIRDTLFRRGVKSIFTLVRSFEEASPAGNIFSPMGIDTVVSVIRDASFALSPWQLDALKTLLIAQSKCDGPTAVPHVLFTLLRGQLNASRLEIVKKAFSHISRKAARASRNPTVDDVRMLFKSAAHPDVVSGRRTEEAVLREFLETFNGSTYIDSDGTVPWEGFAEYYANLSFYYPEDAHFAVVLFDTWELAREDGKERSDLAAGRPSADPVTYSTTHSSRGSPAHLRDWHRDGTLNLTGGGSERDYRQAQKGHGLERLGYGYHSR